MLVGGRYHYQGKLLSGVGFAIDQQGSVAASLIEDGLVVGRYRSICVADDRGYPQIDARGQLLDYQLITYQGDPYTGVAYEFIGGQCGIEAFVRNGVIWNQAHWSNEGRFIYLDIPNEEFGEAYHWHPNGRLKTANISTNSGFFGSIGFDEHARMNHLSGYKGFLKSVEYISSKAAPFFPFESTADIDQMTFACKLRLSGGDVDDVFFESISHNKSIGRVISLHLNSVQMTSPDLRRFVSLEEVHVQSTDHSGISLATYLKQAYPTMRVLADRIKL